MLCSTQATRPVLGSDSPVRRPGEVQEAYSRLREKADSLHATLLQLMERLTPVMSVPTPEKVSDQNVCSPARSPVSPLGTALDELDRMVSGSQSVVLMILNRLEV